mgnify:CR=1 FL=1
MMKNMLLSTLLNLTLLLALATLSVVQGQNKGVDQEAGVVEAMTATATVKGW